MPGRRAHGPHGAGGRGRGYRGGRGVAALGTLAAARRGDRLVVLAVDDDRSRAHAIRFGLDEGAEVECVTSLPAGPIIVRSGRQEIAIGRGLASRVRVQPAERKEA
ncbi:MAG: FeoA family protein [Anaerosomatales bacterium]|nr:FeoA family protein [Anaerosomatales bacterium]